MPTIRTTTEAQQDFQKVLDVDPSSRVAADYKSKAARAHDEFGDKGIGLLGWSFIGGGLALVALTTVIVTLVVNRRWKRRIAKDSGERLLVGRGPDNNVAQFGEFAIPAPRLPMGTRSNVVGYPAPGSSSLVRPGSMPRNGLQRPPGEAHGEAAR
jgi:hypothetical protein